MSDEMMPPLYQWLKADSAVVALVGDGIYRAGNVSQSAAAPYVSWQVISGVPENYADEDPDVDAFRIQVDCWAATADGCAVLARAVRNVLQRRGHMQTVIADELEPETQLYRYGTDWQFWTPRA